MRKHLKKGFTLVELLVVLMLMGLITTAVVMAVRPVMQIYADINYKADEETGSITMFDFLNADLRYATQVKVVSTETNVMPSADSFQNFIVLSNETRASSKKGARGYAQFGKTGSPAVRRPCVNDASLAENDFQFSIENISAMDGTQSLTLKTVAHPMKQNAAGTGFVVNQQKPYTYREAIQFVNMCHKYELPDTVTFGLAQAYDQAKVDNGTHKYIWILYTKPADISGGLTLTPSATSAFAPPNDATKGTKSVAYGATINTLTCVIQEGSIPHDYKIVRAGCVVSYADGSAFNPPSDVVSDDCTINVNIPSGSTFSIRNAANAAMVWYQETGDQLAAAGSHTVYIYDDGTVDSGTGYPILVHDHPYVDPDSFADPKYLRVHYIPTDDEPAGRGVVVSDADTVVKGSALTYFDSGSEKYTTVPDNGAGNIFVLSDQEEITFTVEYKKANAAVNLTTSWKDDSGVHPITNIGDFAESLIPTEGGVTDIYIYGNAVYSSADDLPIPDRLNKDIVVHFIYDTSVPQWDQADYCGVTFIDGDTVKKSSTTDRKSIPDNVSDANDGSLCRIVETSSFDTTVTLIKYNAAVRLHSSNCNYGYSSSCMMTLDENSPDEVWIYKGVAYADKSELPGYRPIDKHITIHYLGGGENCDGIILQDLDNYSENASAKYNGDDETGIPEGGKLAFANSSAERDFDVELILKTDGANVGLYSKEIGSDNYGSALITAFDQFSQEEYWYYAGTLYTSADEAETARKTAESILKVVVHFDANNKKKADSGEEASGFVIGGEAAWQGSPNDREVQIAEGEELTIKVTGSWCNFMFERTFTYEELSSNGVSDIWISGDNMLFSQP